MRQLLLLCLPGILSLLAQPLLPGTGVAQNENARFALHAKDNFTATKAIPTLCNDPTNPSVPNYSPNWEGIDCRDYSVTRPTNESPGPHVYLVVGQASAIGVAGASCGVNYNPGTGQGNGIDPRYVTWTSCTDTATARFSSPTTI